MDKRMQPCLKKLTDLKTDVSNKLDISSHNGINIIETEYATIQTAHMYVIHMSVCPS
jgi:hypothetical protein